MWKDFRGHFAAAAVSVAGFLLYQFVSTFVTIQQLHGVETRHQDQIRVVASRIEEVDRKIDRLQLGLCIMDKRTCKLP